MSEMLKIGIVCYPTIGGSGIVATELGMLFAEAGHEVHFISYERPVRLINCRPNLHFHPVIVNEYSLFKYPDYTLPLSVRILDVCRDYGLDVLHVHYAVPHATAALLATLMLEETSRPALITTLHGTDTNLIGKDPHYQPIVKFSIDHSDGVTTVSESLKRQTIDVFDIRGAIEVIPNFFEATPPEKSREEVRKEIGVSDEKIVLLHMSNLRPGKRVGDILEAVSQCRSTSQVRLLVLAGGDFSPFALEAERLGIADRMIVLENVQEIRNYIGASDLGIYASEEESFGLGILETLAYGKAVIATQVGGIPEVVCHGETGLLVPAHNPAALAAAIDQLVENPDQRDRLGAAARIDAAERFNSSHVRDLYLNYYRRFLTPKDLMHDNADHTNPHETSFQDTIKCPGQ